MYQKHARYSSKQNADEGIVLPLIRGCGSDHTGDLRIPVCTQSVRTSFKQYTIRTAMIACGSSFPNRSSQPGIPCSPRKARNGNARRKNVIAADNAIAAAIYPYLFMCHSFLPCHGDQDSGGDKQRRKHEGGRAKDKQTHDSHGKSDKCRSV